MEKKMNFRKILILSLLFFFFLNLTLVSAQEDTTQEIIGVSDSSNLDSVDDIGIQSSSANLDDSVDSVQDSSKDHLFASEKGNFTELAEKINSATGVLELDKDYAYVSGDTVGTAGIKINKTIIINGNGRTIDGSNLARIFNITSSNVILNNLTLINAKSSSSGGTSNGGAIIVSGANCTIKNSLFKNDYSPYYGGAIYTYGVNTTIDNCNFTNNSAYWGAGAVYSTASNLIVNNSNFNHNEGRVTEFWSDDGGGALYSRGSYAKISNSNFTDNKVVSYGGAVRMDGSYSSISNSTFENNSGGDGGAVAWHGSYGNLNNCSFFDNLASSLDGGGLSWYSTSGNVSDSLFENNTATYRGGGVISQTNNARLNNLTFIGNNASSGAGLFAPSTGSSNTINNNGVLSNSKFIGNHAFYGGGGADITAQFKIINATFENNTANNYGGAVSLAHAQIINSTLINNTASFGGGVYSQNSTISGTNFTDNNAPNGKSAYILNSSNLTNNVISEDDIVVVDNLTKTYVNVDDFTDNLFNTTDGYYGFCAERFNDRPYDGVYDNSLNLLKNVNNGQEVGEYLKILIYQYVDKLDDLKEYTFEDYVWAFTDFEYWNSDDPIIKEVIALYDSGFRVPTENACKVLPNGTLMYFNFSSLITPTAQQNLFLFKLDYGDVMDGNLTKETLNKTVLVGDNAEFRIVVNNKGNSIVYDIFVEDNDYSDGLQFLSWRSEIGNWKYDELTKRWRLDFLESGKSASLILTFKAKENGTLINNVSSGVGNLVVYNSTNATHVYNPNLTVDKISLNKSVEIGKEARFEIIVKNTGEIDLDNVFVLESDYGSGLVYLSYESIKGNWIHSLNDEGKHLFTLNETLKINDTASFYVSFNTTKIGNFSNCVVAGVNGDNITNSTDDVNITNETVENDTDSNETIDVEKENDKIKNLCMDNRRAGNPILALLIALAIIPIRRLKK